MCKYYIPSFRFGDVEDIADRRQEVSDIVKSIENDGYSLILIEGPEGVGKTTVLHHVIRNINAMVYTCSPSDGKFDAVKGLLKSAGREDVFSNIYGEVLAVYGIHREKGLLLSEASIKDGLDGDIFAGMLSAVQAFVKDSLSMISESASPGYLSSLEYGEFRIVIARGEYIDLVAVVHGAEEYALKMDLMRTLQEFEEAYGETLSRWDGNVDKLPLRNFISRFVGEARASDELLISSLLNGLQSLLSTHVISLDDAQWVDSHSLRLLKILVSRAKLENRGKFILSVNTDFEITEDLAEFFSENMTKKVHLGNMDADECVEFLSFYFPDNLFSQDFVERFHSCTAGNPMKMKTLLDNLRSSSVIREEDGFWVAGEFRCHGAARMIPPLSLEEQELLTLCASVGFLTLDLASEILGMGKLAVMKILRKMVRLDILERRGDAYVFSHESIREEMLSNVENDYLEEMLQMAGEYYFERGELARAARILERVKPKLAGEIFRNLGNESIAQGRYMEGAEYLLRASYLLGDEELSLRAGWLFLKLGEYSRAAEVFRELKDEEALRGYVISRAHLGEVVEVEDEVLRMWAEAIVRVHKGDFKGAFQRLKKLIDIREDFSLLLLAGECALFLGENPEPYFSRAYALVEDDIDRLHLLRKELYSLVYSGNSEAALSQVDNAIGLARNLGSWKEMASLLNLKANALMVMGDLSQALSVLYEALRYAEMQDDSNLTSIILGNIALVFLERGEYEKALKYQNKVLSIFEMSGNMHGVAFTKLDIGLSHLGLGDWELALRYLEEAHSMLDDIGDLSTTLYTLHYLLATRFIISHDCEIAREMSRVYEKVRALNEPYTLLELAIVQSLVEKICSLEPRALQDLMSNSDKLSFSASEFAELISRGELPEELSHNSLYVFLARHAGENNK